MGLVTSLIVGGAAGWVAGKVMKSEKSILFNIILGVAGGVIGPFALSIFGLYNSGILGDLVASTLGAILIIYFGRLLLKK